MDMARMTFGEPGGRCRAPGSHLPYRQKVAQAWRGLPLDPSGRYRVEATFYTSGGRNRSDVDNLLKPVLDALTGVVWYDDRQVSEVEASVTRGEQPKTLVRVIRLGDGPSAAPVTRPCDHCGAPVTRAPSQFKGARLFCQIPHREQWKREHARPAMTMLVPGGTS